MCFKMFKIMGTKHWVKTRFVKVLHVSLEIFLLQKEWKTLQENISIVLHYLGMKSICCIYYEMATRISKFTLGLPTIVHCSHDSGYRRYDIKKTKQILLRSLYIFYEIYRCFVYGYRLVRDWLWKSSALLLGNQWR